MNFVETQKGGNARSCTHATNAIAVIAPIAAYSAQTGTHRAQFQRTTNRVSAAILGRSLCHLVRMYTHISDTTAVAVH